MMADLIAEGLHVGLRALTLAAIPETCGHAMEVPESTLNNGGSFPFGASDVSFAIQAASMSTPGAEISGCKTIMLGGGFEFSVICCLNY